MVDDRDLAGLLADGVLDGGNVDTDDVSRLPDTANAGALPQIAFALWAYEAGRDMGKTQSLLAERTGMTVPVNQIRDWRISGRWNEIAGVVHQALEGQAIQTSRAMLTKGTVDAVSLLIAAVKDESANLNTRVRAAMTILDRGGFPVLLRGETVSDALSHTSAYADLTDEELEAEYREFNADTYNDKHEDIAERVSINGHHATQSSILSR